MPHTIQYCSDLHLEFPLNAQFMKKYPLEVTGDILLLAGDIVPFAVMDKHKDFFDFVADHYEATYWVPGNHEYYHSDIAERCGTVYEKIRDNVFLVNNVTVEKGDTQLIFCTLWSHIDPAYEWEIMRAMSDFHVIKHGGNRLSVADFNRLHSESLTFIKQAVADNILLHKVVVSHHIPTFMHYPQQFRGSVLKQAFATELYDFIEPSGIHSWIYGHHHSNIPDFKIGTTSLLTNQLGYVKHGEHGAFSRAGAFQIQ